MSTTLLPIIYQLDSTGTNVNNKVVREPHQLETRRIRAVAPLHAPFFTESVVILDSLTGLVVPPASYKYFSLQALASAMYGKEICDIILITDPTVSDNIEITYQSLGGEYTRIYDSTVALLNLVNSDSRPVEWPNIINRPETFNPTLHLHSAGDPIGFEYLIASLERLRISFMTSSSLTADDVLKYLDSRLELIAAENANLANALDSITTSTMDLSNHIADHNNPHQTTKAQVGLSKVANYTYTKQPVDMSSLSIMYVTNVILKDYLDNTFSGIEAEINTKFNTINDSSNLLASKITQLENLTGNLFNIQVTSNSLNSKYTDLNSRMIAVENNLLNAPNRIASVLDQYAGSGI